MFCIHMNCIMIDILSSCRKSYSCWLFQYRETTVPSRGTTVLGNELGFDALRTRRVAVGISPPLIDIQALSNVQQCSAYYSSL